TVPAGSVNSFRPARSRGTPKNSTVTSPVPPMPALSPLEEELFRRPPQQPVPVRVTEEVEPPPDQVNAVLVTVPIRYLERTVTLPHAAPGAERLDDAPDRRSQVGVRGLLLAQRVERADLHQHARVPGHTRERVHVLVADGAVHADAAEVVDDDR